MVKRLGLIALPQEPRAKKMVKPEIGLWSAVLKRALQDAIICKKEQWKRDAFRWLNDEDYHTGSVRWVCEYLDIMVLDEIRRIVNDGDVADYVRIKRVIFR